MNRLARITVFMLALLLWPGVSAAASGEQENLVLAAQSDTASLRKSSPEAAADTSGELDMDEYLYGHVGDAYGWHITTVNGHPVTVHLPVIVRSKTTGWHIFSSKRIEEGEEYEGFRIAAKGEPNEGKLVEETAGGIVRPLDISITKNVFGLMVNSLVVVLKVCVGPDYKRYSPYLLTAFFFIFINNLMGIIPIFPGGANITGNIAVTFTLAICTFLAVNLFGNKHYYKDIFWPDVPVFLKAIPLMPLIEIIGVFTKPFSLMIRLFANILAGHMMLLGVVAVVFLTAKMGIGLNAGMSFIAVCFGVFMDILELLVAFLQAYVFTMLSSVFIGLSRQAPEKE